MTIDQLKTEASGLSFSEQGELAAFLVQLRNRRDPECLAEMQRRIEDRDPDHWLTPEQFEERLGSG